MSNLAFAVLCGALRTTAGGMASKGIRNNNISEYTDFNASDELCKPLRPLFAIPFVGHRRKNLIETTK